MFGRLRKTGALIDMAVAPAEHTADDRDLRGRVRWIVTHVFQQQAALPIDVRDQELMNRCLEVYGPIVRGERL